VHDFLSRLGIEPVNSGAATTGGILATTGPEIEVNSPIDGAPIAKVRLAERAEYETVVAEAARVFHDWRMVPAPKRGEILREVGDALRAHKQDLGRLVTLEVGKILSEGLGEVQESVDMADLAVGMSRQLSGLTMHSERPGHRMYEQWHPLGPVGIITAFNFPNAVWAWNAMVATACGDTAVWKPSLKAPLTAIATHRICDGVFQKHGWGGVLGLVIGHDASVGEAMIGDHRFPLISATGSTRMGRHVGATVAKRFGRSLLELGGNNAILVHKDADLDLALRAIVFASCGTAGQRCTTTRRLLVHADVYDALVPRIAKAFDSIRIGDPLESGVLMGPLIDADAVRQYEAAIDRAKAEGGTVITGAARLDRPGFYVRPTLIAARPDMPVCQEETFAPILYVFRYTDLADAIRIQNDVPQGLSSAIFTESFKAAERFLSHGGSDCGIANVNIGTSGAEIGGAFGGEKETGGGREAGSDSWKAYMRRQTCTMNWSDQLPLAQGVTFDL
jgi:aldehyde dehydrogenase (NAD+)